MKFSMHFLRLAPLVFACALTAACAVSPELRYQVSGLNGHFDPPVSYADYLAKTRDVIAQSRTDLPPDPQQKLVVVEGNAPFEVPPAAHCRPGASHRYQRAVVMTHGLTDSPYHLRALAEFFRNECFLVRSVLLPGHGTRPADLLNVTWQEWAAAVKFAVDATADEVDAVYLLGFSTGAALSILQAREDSRIRGLFLLSPAVAVTPLARVACWRDKLGTVVPGWRWLDAMPDADHFKYESFASNAACQIFRLTQEIAPARNGVPLSLPLFIVASEDDTTVDSAATIELYSSAVSPLKHLLLYTSKPQTKTTGVEVVDSRIPDQHVLSSAHTAMSLPPNHPHYGRLGDYRSCTHYYKKAPDVYRRCSDGNYEYLGEISADNLKTGVVRRLTYNPFYDRMLGSMRAFIAELPER